MRVCSSHIHIGYYSVTIHGYSINVILVHFKSFEDTNAHSKLGRFEVFQLLFDDYEFVITTTIVYTTCLQHKVLCVFQCVV